MAYQYDPDEFFSDAEILALEQRLRPNLYAVFNLKRQIRGTRLTHAIIDDEATKVMARVSRHFVTKHQFRHTPVGKRLLPNMITLEKVHLQPHINLAIKCPANLSVTAVGEALKSEWSKSPWAETYESALWWEERSPGTDLIGYICKEGRNSVLEKPQTFPAE